MFQGVWPKGVCVTVCLFVERCSYLLNHWVYHLLFPSLRPHLYYQYNNTSLSRYQTEAMTEEDIQDTACKYIILVRHFYPITGLTYAMCDWGSWPELGPHDSLQSHFWCLAAWTKAWVHGVAQYIYVKTLVARWS